MSRRRIATVVLVLWLIGLGLLARRQWGKTDAQRLADGAKRVAPTTYYYTVTRGDTTLGDASSAIDTAGWRLRATYSFRNSGTNGELKGTTRSSVMYLSRRFVLDSMALLVENGGNGWKGDGVHGKQNGSKRSLFRIRRSANSSPILPPTLLPMALMLSRDPKVGRSAGYWMYNPVRGKISHVTLRIAAESLFTVSDSATYNPASGWTSAHTDTVRAWSIVATGVDGKAVPLGSELMLEWMGVAPTESRLTVWVDVHGSVVSASEPGGVQILRTAYEIAYHSCSKTSLTKSC